MNILVVDDHPIFREGVACVLRQLADVREVLLAGDGQQALRVAAERPDLDVVIVDLKMAGTGGVVVVERLRKMRPALPAIVLSSSEDPNDVRRALAAGARGYCPKSSSHATLLAALQLVLSGEVYVPPLMALAQAPLPAASNGGLTARQREVLQQLCCGHSNKQIARELGMEEKTVKGHVSAIFRTLHVMHRMQAVEVARSAGLVS